MYPICPHHECAHFRLFLPFSIFLARHAPCSAPPCTPDAGTNGLYLACCLCILVSMTHMPRGRTKAPTYRELAQSQCGQFCHFGTCGLSPGHHHALAYGDIEKPSTRGPTLDSHWVPHRTLSPVSKPIWRNALGDIFIFGSFLGMSNHPFWNPNFSPPCGQLAAPYLYAHEEPGPKFKSHT